MLKSRNNYLAIRDCTKQKIVGNTILTSTKSNNRCIKLNKMNNIKIYLHSSL